MTLPNWPHVFPKQKKPRKGRCLPPPQRSARLYFYIAPDKVHMFRYMLEAEDNLGLMTVVDRWRAALMLRYSPHQEKEIRLFIERVRPLLALEGPVLPQLAANPLHRGCHAP